MTSKTKSDLDLKSLTDLIYQRLNGTVSKRIIRDSLSIIVSCMVEKLLDNQAVYIDNFGILSPYVKPETNGIKLHTQEPVIFPAKKKIRFVPSYTLKKMLKVKREKLKGRI